jgi:hypothetical protein
VQALPSFIKKIENPDLDHGIQMGNLAVWPVARPEINLEPGEVFKFGLRIRPLEGAPLSLQLFTESSNTLKASLRKETNFEGYWLDLELGPINEPGARTIPLLLASATGELTINVEANVIAEGLIVTPPVLDMGDVSHADLKDGSRRMGRFGVRKSVGTFRIKSISTTLPFLKLEQQVISESTNYVIRVILETTTPPKLGVYNGTVKVETDDPRSPKVEVPVKLHIVK